MVYGLSEMPLKLLGAHACVSLSVGLVMSDETTLGDPRPDPVHSVRILVSCMEYFVMCEPHQLALSKGQACQA